MTERPFPADDRSERRRDAIRQVMERLGLKPTPWCRRAGIDPAVLNHFLKGRNASLNARSEEKLAEAAGITVAELRGETAPAPDLAPIRAVARFGVPVDDPWPMPVEAVPVPPEIGRTAPGAGILAVRLADTHADHAFPSGSLLLVVPVDAGDDLSWNDTLLVEIPGDDGTEILVMGLHIGRVGDLVLEPLASRVDQRRQIVLPRPEAPPSPARHPPGGRQMSDAAPVEPLARDTIVWRPAAGDKARIAGRVLGALPADTPRTPWRDLDDHAEGGRRLVARLRAALEAGDMSPEELAEIRRMLADLGS